LVITTIVSKPCSAQSSFSSQRLNQTGQEEAIRKRCPYLVVLDRRANVKLKQAQSRRDGTAMMIPW
jgi:hypothetical protein